MTQTTREAKHTPGEVSKREALEFLMRVHYGFFMANRRFWYDQDLQEADALVCIAASDLRHELKKH